MSGASANIALIFDFDDTLVPDSTSTLLKQHGMNPEHFWLNDVKKLVSSGYDPTLAYLHLILQNVGSGRPLGNLRNKDLREFGKKLNSQIYAGLPTLFRDLRRTAEEYENINIEFYAISGGLKEVIEATDIIKNNFKAVYACELAGDTDNGSLKHIKRAVTFTEKTRYLFEINKGIDQRNTKSNPYLVNKDVPPSKRRIPFKNMIYVGDGLTDVPCFSLVKNFGGTAFGVFKPGEEKSAKQALQELLKTERVISAHAPRYGKKDELGSFIRAAVASICTKAILTSKETEESY